MSGKNGGGDKAADDNRKNQMNPNNDAYWSSRDEEKPHSGSSDRED